MSFGRQLRAVLSKELRVELRTREILYTMAFFGLVIVVVFGFGLFDRRTAALAAPGVLWTALLLAGTVSINRTFEREREGDCITGLVLVPGIAPALFVGKMLANLLFLMLTLCLIGPLVMLAFQYETVPNAGGVLLAVFLGAIGYSILGTLVGGMLGQVRMRAILLPLVLFPMVIPVFGIGVTATAKLLSQGDSETVRLEVTGAPATGETVGIELFGGQLTHRVGAGEAGDPVAVANALTQGLQTALERGDLEGLKVSHDPERAVFTLVSDPGLDLDQVRAGPGVAELGRDEIDSPGYGYLWVLLALDGLLLVVSTWLFGRLLEP